VRLSGQALLRQEKYAEAEPSLLTGCRGLEQRAEKTPAGGEPYLKEMLRSLVQLREQTNWPQQGAEWKKKLAEFDSAQQ
jgi:hypothetical protein